MNRDQISGNWKILRGKIKEKWGTRADRELDVNRGNLDRSSGMIPKRYDLAEEVAEEEMSRLCEEECPPSSRM